MCSFGVRERFSDYLVTFREFNYSKAIKQDRLCLELNLLKEAGLNRFSVFCKEIPVRSQGAGGEALLGRPYLYLELPLDVDFKRLPPTLFISDEDLIPPSLLVMFKPPSYSQATPDTLINSLTLLLSIVVSL